MGKEITEDEKNKKSWDSNAITPGTPFMELLSVSLRYWVVKKMNSDPGWKQVCRMAFTYTSRIDIPVDRSDHIRRKRPRRRRTQNHGLYQTPTVKSRSRPQHTSCHLWFGKCMPVFHQLLILILLSKGRGLDHARACNTRASLQGSS